MKNNILKGILLFSTISTVIACAPKKTEAVAVDKEQIKKEIQAKENEFAATYNAGEMKNIGYYADDAASYYQNKAPLVGKTAIVEFLLSSIESKSDKISFTTSEVFVSADGLQVVEIGHYSVNDSTNTEINSGNYMSLFEKRNGQFVCVRDMSASDKPLE